MKPVSTPLWNPPDITRDQVVLRHYTERLEANPDFAALREALVARRDEILNRLVGPMGDKADTATLHMLRGQLKAYQEILDQPAREAKRYQEARST